MSLTGIEHADEIREMNRRLVDEAHETHRQMAELVARFRTISIFMGAAFSIIITIVAVLVVARFIVTTVPAQQTANAFPSAVGDPGVIFVSVVFFGLGLTTSMISRAIHASYATFSQISAVPRWLENLEVMRRYVADEPIIAKAEGRMQ
jgi:hypothetical protein